MGDSQLGIGLLEEYRRAVKFYRFAADEWKQSRYDSDGYKLIQYARTQVDKTRADLKEFLCRVEDPESVKTSR